jgi:xanthine dehydrogenase YagR molybdenum-binding subunit
VLWQHQVLAAAASRLAKRPVRMMLSREGVYRMVGGRSLTEQRVALGAARTAARGADPHRHVRHDRRTTPCPNPSSCRRKRLCRRKLQARRAEPVDLDMLANTFMRAPGEAVGTFALECAIDELAEALGMDPIELRIRNEPEKDPTPARPSPRAHSGARPIAAAPNASAGTSASPYPAASATANG